MERTTVLGVPVDLLDAEGALSKVETAIRDNATMHIVTLNAEMAMLAKENSEFAEIMQRAGLVLPDGSGVVWAVRRQGKKIHKLAGVDFVSHLARQAQEKGWKLFLLGARPEIVSQAAEKLETLYPGTIAGHTDGYFKEDAPVLEAIQAAKPDILLVALGVPRQEKWIAQYQRELNIPICMGVGGSFDVIAGAVPRAPKLMQKMHLEWLFRLYLEPWRWRRMMVLPRFVGKVWRERVAD